ncbi:HAD-IA family hydrolase [Luteolibacter luteus]|uniref:HAD-IA family hydrolase n=1 Tax=Luteolibacter luteus TaxID=2728835 RepID=A0A858RDK2_9BACT|nr:HAD-IA family hydrolase [Luteolibacter luteus]QJE94668.1 HAD-IA family hydrolase [Luteolibacter luteus]
MNGKPPLIRRSVAMRHPVWSSYGPLVMAGVVDFMREEDPWRLATENDSYGEMEAVKIDREWHGDGLILFRATEDELAEFRRRGQAVVLTSTEGPDLGFPRVVPDNQQIGRVAAEHLIECSVPHFAFLARGETFYREEQFAPGLRRYARERLGGFRSKLAEYAIEPTVHYLKGRPLWKDQTWREVETEVMAFLDLLPRPCGLFVVDDSLGAVVLRAADRLGIRVPGELAVIGFGDDPSYCFATFPALSSIAYPGREIGKQAAAMLWQQMNGGAPPPVRTEVAVQTVVARESSDTLAIEDEEIRDLVRFIRRQAPHEALRVAELAERTTLSMTTIKARFATVLGHGPKQEIQRVRLRHLRHLLMDHRLSLAEIARQMQFGTAHELSRFFLAETGQRPTDFRGKPETATPGKVVSAVIFDMDGTLFDTEPVYFEAYRHAFAAQGGELSREVYFSKLMGLSNAAIETALGAMAQDRFDVRKFRKGWKAKWRALLAANPLEVLPGVRELLERLMEDRIRIGLASSSDREDIELSLESAGLASHFPVRAAGDEVPEGKPAPDVYLLACQRLGVDPKDCIAIEDSPHGVAAAQAAGIRVLAITTAAVEGPCLRKANTLAELGEGEWKEILGTTRPIRVP